MNNFFKLHQTQYSFPVELERFPSKCDNILSFIVECVKLLLANGADPRTEDNEGTTPFDLAKDDEIRSILHEAMIEKDTKEEANGEVCNNA